MTLNLCLAPQGTQRFSSYSGCGSTFKFTGAYEDESEVSNIAIAEVGGAPSLDLVRYV